MNRFICLCFTALILCGCWDKAELNDRAYVNSISIDKNSEYEDKAGNNEAFTVGISISDITSYEGSDKGGMEEGQNKSFKKRSGATVSQAIRMAEDNSSQKLFFGHLRAVLIGEELLADKKLFLEALDAIERDNELSRKSLVLAVMGDASELCALNPPGEPSIGVFADKFYKEEKSGATFKMTFEDLVISLENNNNAVIPVIKKEKDELKINGACLVKDFKLGCFMDEKETRGYLWQQGIIKDAKITVDYIGETIPVNIASANVYLSFRSVSDKLVMDVNIEAAGKLTGYTFGKELTTAQIKEIETKTESIITKEIQEANQLLQKRMKADALDINGLLKKKAYPLWIMYKDNWQNVFESMEITPNVTVKISGGGRKK